MKFYCFDYKNNIIVFHEYTTEITWNIWKYNHHHTSFHVTYHFCVGFLQKTVHHSVFRNPYFFVFTNSRTPLSLWTWKWGFSALKYKILCLKLFFENYFCLDDISEVQISHFTSFFNTKRNNVREKRSGRYRVYSGFWVSHQSSYKSMG